MSPKTPRQRHVRVDDGLSRQGVLDETDSSGETVEDNGQASVVRNYVAVGIYREELSLGHSPTPLQAMAELTCEELQRRP
jgi:hypothetical protein